MEELGKLKRTPSARKAEREKRVGTLINVNAVKTESRRVKMLTESSRLRANSLEELPDPHPRINNILLLTIFRCPSRTSQAICLLYLTTSATSSSPSSQ
ncbi:hypothetical protein Patl1_21215 [Pistacia atlantica]|uniref:Uncharacterized protein n=1 Tax=Pistacia atlantica TaxID=434234 RepID=A0ACC1BKE1_9ROSI|nr:hypothetical protein Patl1_21215 [Pistacia atlantica]